MGESAESTNYGMIVFSAFLGSVLVWWGLFFVAIVALGIAYQGDANSQDAALLASGGAGLFFVGTVIYLIGRDQGKNDAASE